MSKQELTSLLQQYFSKNISAAQQQELAERIARHTSEEQLKDSIEELWNQYEPQEQMPAQTSEACYNRILHQIKQLPADAATETIRAIPTVHRVHFLQRSWVRMAVAAVVLAVAGTVVYFMLPGSKHQRQAGLINPPASKAIIRNLTLPDGSHVLLQANSRLQYPEAFNASTREVTLTGEAYFDVAHNPAQPFIIHSGNIKTTVLGTAFNIKAWPEDKEVTITVTRGKVKVENEKGLVGILTPDQQLSINTRVNTAKQQAVNAENVASWKNSEYTLDDMTLADAITELEVRYGTIIELAEGEKPGNCRFTASFKQAESLDYVLDVICKIYQASWQKEKGSIVITHVQCND